MQSIAFEIELSKRYKKFDRKEYNELLQTGCLEFTVTVYKIQYCRHQTVFMYSTVQCVLSLCTVHCVLSLCTVHCVMSSQHTVLLSFTSTNGLLFVTAIAQVNRYGT